jgi:hypothetical protein
VPALFLASFFVCAHSHRLKSCLAEVFRKQKYTCY